MGCRSYAIPAVTEECDCHCIDITGRHEGAGLAGVHQLNVAAYVGRNYRKSGCHGFEDRVRYAFRKRRKNETVEPTHNCSYVQALTGQPSQSTYPASLEDGLSLIAQWPIANHNETQA